jgi:signal peptidase I
MLMDDSSINSRQPDAIGEPAEAAGDAAPQPTLPPATQAAAKRPARRRITFDLTGNLQFALLALTIALFVITFIVQAFRIPSGSMEDTLLVGDYLLVDKTRFAPSGHIPLLPYRAVRRGDIVVFRYPVDPSQHFVKRVVGLPGDRVHLWHGRVFLNGHALTEPYVVYKERFPDEFRDNFPRGNRFNENVTVSWAQTLRSAVKDGELTVPPGQYFVMGDNRDQSLDSRYWGFVPRQNIIGRPMFLYLSLATNEDEDDDDSVASRPQDDRLFTLRARISRLFGEVRWHRILRLAP